MALTSTITLAGNLTQDPELRTSQNGKPIARVSVAVNRRQFDQATKEWKDGEPVFWRGTAFGDLAEHIAHSLAKGHRVILHGTVQADNWTDKDSGVKRTEKSLLIEDIGPSLMFANATPGQAARRQSTDTADSADSWASAPGDDTPF